LTIQVLDNTGSLALLGWTYKRTGEDNAF